MVIKFGTSKDRMPKLEKKHSIAVDVGTESVTAQSLNCLLMEQMFQNCQEVEIRKWLGLQVILWM